MSNNLVEEIQVSPIVETPVLERKEVWPLYALFTGNIISYIGNTLTLLAIPWFVLQTTNNAALAGIVGFFSLLSTVLSSFLSGSVVGRLGYRRASVVSDVLSGITVLLVPLLYYTIGLPYLGLLVLVFLGGLLRAPGATARATLLPNLAERAQMRLERANAFENGGLRISAFVGAPLAGILIATIGTSNLLWLDALTFFLSALIIGLAVPARLPVEARLKGKAGEKVEGKPARSLNLKAGLSFLSDPIMLTLIAVFVVTNMLDSASSAVVTPVYTLQTYHSAVPLGLLVAALGGMGFVGTLLYAAIGHKLPRRLTLGLSFLLGGAMRFWVLLVPILPVQVAWFALAGLAMGPINPLVFTVIQERTPRENLANVMGIGGAMVMAGMPLGALVSGFVIAGLGLRLTLIIMGAIYLVAALSVLLNGRLKQMERVAA